MEVVLRFESKGQNLESEIINMGHVEVEIVKWMDKQCAEDLS